MNRLSRELFGIELILEWKNIAEDMVVTLTGWVEHIGAVAAGSFDRDSGRSYSSVITLPGHREDELALYGARMFSAASASTTVFIVGIHLNNITKDEILEIVRVSKEMIGELSAILKEDR